MHREQCWSGADDLTGDWNLGWLGPVVSAAASGTAGELQTPRSRLACLGHGTTAACSAASALGRRRTRSRRLSASVRLL